MAVIKVTSDSMVYTLTATCTFRFEEILKVALNQCKATVKPLIASVDAPDAFLKFFLVAPIFRNELVKAINKATKQHVSWSFCKTSAFWVPDICFEVHNISD